MSLTDDKRATKHLTMYDRRYAIRIPISAEAEILNLETGKRLKGATTDISLGGCFVTTERPLSRGCRVRAFLSQKSERVEILAVVRSVKDRVGMGIEFLDLDESSHAILRRWVATGKTQR
ncbi:MAG: PilZ domain-containing protein [Acidobacteriia bacterium]|nr:PilZ domain-containing protein [Terriglobia bacterium]